MRLVKTISLPGATDIRGAVASPPTHTLYVSYGGDGGVNGNGSMLAYDLLTDNVMWTKTYSAGVDSMAITPDGKTIYMPTGEASSSSNWNIIDAATGNVTGSIIGGSAPHNTIVSLNGKDVYMGGRNASYLTVADTATNTVIRQIGPLFNGGVRPFTINGKETLAFTTATGLPRFPGQRHHHRQGALHRPDQGRLPVHARPVRSLVPEPRHLAVTRREGTLGHGSTKRLRPCLRRQRSSRVAAGTDRKHQAHAADDR